MHFVLNRLPRRTIRYGSCFALREYKGFLDLNHRILAQWSHPSENTGNMRFAPLVTFIACSLLQTAFAGTYSLSDTFVGSSFLTGFDHQAIADPTHGRV